MKEKQLTRSPEKGSMVTTVFHLSLEPRSERLILVFNIKVTARGGVIDKFIYLYLPTVLLNVFVVYPKVRIALAN